MNSQRKRHRQGGADPFALKTDAGDSAPEGGRAGFSKAFLRPEPRPEAAMRLICFPHGGGSAQSFRSWPALLPPCVELLAYQPPGRGPRRREPPIEDMRALAQTLADELGPLLDRPYALFGHSVGALIAFECAQALRAAGRPAPTRLILSGYAAPDLAEGTPPLHELADDALWEKVAALGLSPDLASAGEELRALALPAVRADFGLAERHRVSRAAPRVETALTLLAGAEDPIAPAGSMAGWADFFDGAASTEILPGGHFFTETARADLLAVIAAQLESDLENDFAARRPSILHGAPHEAPDHLTLDELFREQASRTPSSLAIEAEDRTLDFAELDRLSDMLARRFKRLGAGRDKLVGLFLETSADYMVAYLAALKAGAAYLPLDPSLPEAALRETLDKLRPVALAARPASLARLPKEWPDQKTVILSPDWPYRLEREGAGAPNLFDSPRPDDLAYAVLSSGTTGAPKAILCPHRGAVISYWWRYRHLPYGEEEREAANVFFVWEALRPLLQGLPLYPIPDDAIFDPRKLVAHLERRRITRVLFTPSLLEQILRSAERGALGDLRRRLAALRIIVLNGEVVTTTLWRRARRALPDVRLVNDYSISETHDVCHIDLSRRAPGPEQARAPAGEVMDGVSLYILGENGEPAPWGEKGEVYVGGPTLARGYLGLEEETQARFLPDPYRDEPGARMFRTGDLGRLLPDGALDVSGRARFLIKLRGYSIVPGAVEAALTSHPAVDAAAILPADEPESGVTQGLVAYFSASRAIDDERLGELRAHLKSRLPAYAVPARLVHLDPWPIDAATGKLDRRMLPDPWATLRNAEPGAGRPETTDLEKAPDVEAVLISIWSGLLGETPSGPDADFFDLGGHSLKAVELALSIEEAFGARLDVVDLFDRPRLGQMARAIEVAIGRRTEPEAPSLAKSTAAASPARGRGESRGREIAVLSLAGRFAGAECETGDLSAFWDLLIEGRSGLRRLTDEELDALGVRASLRARPDYVPVAGSLENIELFDPQLFGLSPREASLIDPQHRLFLETCWRALEFAGYAPRAAEAALEAMGRAGGVGVWAGCWLPLYLTHHLGGAAALDPSDPTGFHLAEIGNDKDYLASRASYLLNLSGPANVVQTSCSTGLVAIAEAAQALRDGRCAMALAGAASLTLPRGGYVAAAGHVGSPSGQCRSFDADADGVVFSDGVGAAVLKRLDDALEDGDPIVAVIKGFAVSSDGSGKAGFSAPGVRGQERAIAAALADAGVARSSVGYVEAHGTGTVIGDPIEATALTRAYGAGEEAAGAGAVRLGSLKPNLGHANIAAGVAGFAKAALALERRFLPPTIGVRRPNPKLNLERSPFRLQTDAEPWRQAAGPRRAGVSSLGVGGVNCHMILEEAPEPAPAAAAVPEALLLSARSAEGLAGLARATADRIEADPALDLGAVAETLRSGREPMAYRLAVAAPDLRSAPARLRAAAEAVSPDPAPRDAPRLAFVYAGHGAQHALMGAGLHRHSPAFRQRFDACRGLFADLAARDGGKFDLQDLFDAHKSEGLLATPLGLQASVFAVQVAMTATLEAAGVRPVAVAGHSLGEYAAGVAAGALDLEAAAALIAARARATVAAPSGAMLAVSGEEAATEALAEELGGVSIAAWNASGELAVAGAPQAISAFEQAAPERGLAVARLSAPRAFHSPHMAEAAGELKDAAWRIADERPFRPPSLPFASTLTGAWASSGAPLGPDYWSRQMREPVRFGAAMRQLASGGVAAVLEIGPGRGLGRLIRKSIASPEDAQAGAGVETIAAMRHPKEAAPDLDALHRALARLWERGAEIRWTDFRTPVEAMGRPRRVALPGPRFERRRCWVEPASDAPAASPRDADRLLSPSDRLHLPVFRRTAPAQAAPQGRWRWLVLVDPAAPGPHDWPLLDGLRQAGDNVEIRGGRAALEAGDGASASVDRVLWLRGAQSGEALAPAADLARFAALLAGRAGEALTVFALSSGALAVGCEKLRPHAALRLGPLLALGQEAPRIGVRAIDLDPERPAPAAQILRELRAEDLRPEPFCALRGPHLWVEDFEPLPATPYAREAGRALLRSGSGFVVTGGFGRIGLALAERLAAHGAPVLLAGRDASRGAERIARLRETGASVETLALDISAPGAAEKMVSAAQKRFGGLTGVFHAAGLADLKYLGETTEETLAAEFAAKVGGTRALARAIEGMARPPAFVALFSSLAAPLGGLGMGGYGAANRFLDLFAEARAAEAASGAPTRWLSVAWDDWAFEYGKEQVGAWARTRAGLALPPVEALDSLETLLGSEGLSAAVVAATPLAPRVERWRWSAGRAAQALPVERLQEDDAAQFATRGRAGESEAAPLQEAALDAYRAALGASDIRPDSDFFDLGGDSLLAAQLVARLAETLAGRRIAARRPRISDVFDHPTPQRLALALEKPAAEAHKSHGSDHGSERPGPPETGGA